MGQPKGREKKDPLVGKTQGKKAYQGKLAVMVDSERASAGELFARVVQLEKRGTIIGDRTAGAVMQSRQYSRQLGGDNVIVFAISIAEAADLYKSIQNYPYFCAKFRQFLWISYD